MQVSRSVLSILLFVASSTVAFAQTKTPMKLDPKPASTPQGMEGGLWRTDQDFDSVLYLKNVLINQSITATPTLYMADGTPFDLAPVTLDPAGVATININRSLHALPPALQAHLSTFGMVGVRYQWSWAAGMLATVRNVDEVAMVSFESSLASDVNTAHAAVSTPPAQQQEALWWKATTDSSGFVVLSNSLLAPLPVLLTANDNHGIKKGSKQIVLQAHSSQWVSLADVLGSTPKLGDAGSVTATYAGPDNSLLINGGMQDNTTGYSATLHFRERHPELAWNPSEHTVVLDAPGIMYGPQNPKMQFPENTAFALYSALHNLSGKDRQVTLSLTYAGTAGPETHSLNSLTVAANTTQLVDIPALMHAANIAPATTSVDLSYTFTGNEFDLETEQGSVDQSMNYVFAVPAHKEDWTIGRTICHWNLQGDNNTMISLWNYTASPEDLKLTLYYHGGQYSVPVHLEPRADYEMDIASLVHSQAPDASGAVIPTSITEGSALLTDAKGEGTRINVASNTAEFNVRNATCGVSCTTCNGVTQASLITLPFTLIISQTRQSSGKLTYNTGSTYQTTSGNWSSNGPAVSVNQSGLLTGVSPGSNEISLLIDGQPVGAGYICNPNAACPPPENLEPSAPAQTSPTVTVVNANITTDQITVQLAAGDNTTTGPLEIEIDGPNVVDQPQNGGSYTSGSYTFNFNQDNLGSYPGEYTTVKATWTVNGQQYVGTLSYSFNVLGIYRQTQYNTPAESSCSGGPTPISVFSGGYPSCPHTDTTVISGFDYRVTNPAGGTGSGHSINFGDVQQESACSSGSGDLRGHVTIQGSLGRVGNDTVAACGSSQIYNPGVQVYIRGEGVKTVTDRCNACCTDPNAAHLDNYTTNTACSGVPSLPSALTVQLQ